MNDKTKGILFLLLSALAFSMMATFVKLSGDLPTVQKTFFRDLVTLIIALGFAVYHKERLFGKKKNQIPLLLRSVFGLLGTVFYFYAIDHLILSDADMLNKLSPFLMVVFSSMFLKEKARPYQILMIIFAFVGALFIIKPVFSVNIVPYSIGVLSSVFAAGAYTFLRVLGNREKYYTVVFYFSFFSTVAILPFVTILYQPMSWQQLLYLCLTGFSAALGQFGITLAYKFAPAKEISIFFYSTVLYSTVISIVVFNQHPDVLSFIGYTVILGALFYMFLKNRKDAKP